MEFKLKTLAQINQKSLKKATFPEDIVYLDTKNLTNGKFEELVYFNKSKDKIPSRARRIVQKNDILISTVRPNQKHYGFITKDKENYIVSTGFAVITPDETKVNPYFLYKYLTLDSITNYLQNIAENSTSAYPAIKPSVLSELSIILPDKTIQDYISKLLRSIDNKIDLNEQIITNLEELSQTLFKRWFVDFEFPDENGNPYKSSGGEMVDSEIGEIPKEWYIKSINEITSRVRTGLNPRKNFVLGYGENYYVTIKNMSNNNIYLNEKCDRINDEALKIINKRSDLKKNDILFSGIGTIGRVYLVSEEPENWNISESIFTLRPSESLYSYYLYQLMLSENLQNYVQQLSSGSVQKGIRKGDLIKFKLPISKNNFIENLYSNKIKNYIFKVQNLRKENLKLVKLRDTLLPKLMSGEIEIPDEIEVNEDELSI